MATQDVPGASPANRDELHAGCWAEHADGSLIFVKGAEGGKVVYEIYDLAYDPPVSYTDAMEEGGFKKQFSYPPVGVSKDRWTWHDKTAFPWDRVMKRALRPRPETAFAEDQMTAAERVAQSLKLRAREVHEDAIRHNSDDFARKGLAVLDRIAGALDGIARIASPKRHAAAKKARRR